MSKKIVIDVESDGQVPHLYSMVCFGAIVVEKGLNRTFYGQTAPISDNYDPEALAVSGFTREEHLQFPDPRDTMVEFYEWLESVSGGKRMVMFSDNNGYDWSFINYYMHRFCGDNKPLGWSSRRIGDLYCGLKKDSSARWKHLRKTKHTHHPVDDAKGNAEAILYMKHHMGLKIKL